MAFIFLQACSAAHQLKVVPQWPQQRMPESTLQQLASQSSMKASNSSARCGRGHSNATGTAASLAAAAPALCLWRLLLGGIAGYTRVYSARTFKEAAECCMQRDRIRRPPTRTFCFDAYIDFDIAAQRRHHLASPNVTLCASPPSRSPSRPRLCRGPYHFRGFRAASGEGLP